jgi:hypothetical protein
MFDLRKLFLREARARRRQPLEADSDYHPSEARGEGLEVEYQGLIATQFRRWGIETGCVTVEVRQIGRGPDGFDIFVGMVRLANWERTSGLRVLLGLPLLEARVRKAVRATWLADYSHFGGLWLHASEQIHQARESSEIGELLQQLAPRRRPAGVSHGGPSTGDDSSIPATTGGPSTLPPLARPHPMTASARIPTPEYAG